jgi:hypothetical protein
MGLSTELMTSMMARLRRRAVSSAITSLTTVAFRAAMTAFLATRRTVLKTGHPGAPGPVFWPIQGFFVPDLIHWMLEVAKPAQPAAPFPIFVVSQRQKMYSSIGASSNLTGGSSPI